jgi:Protein of unknown function (DUF3168)
MTIESGLRACLLADPAIATAVGGGRIYPIRLPQKVTLPAIVLQEISSVRHAHLRGQGALARPRFQVDSYGSTYDAAVALGAEVRTWLSGRQETWTDPGPPEASILVRLVLFATEQDLYEPDILGGSCRHSADYFIFHDTANGVV